MPDLSTSIGISKPFLWGQLMFNMVFSSVVNSVVKDVVKVLGGPPRAFDPASLFVVGTMAQVPGDYIEIGTWFGASALVTALIKKRMGVDGTVTCIDPFKGDTPEYRLATPSKEAVLESAQKLDVELDIIAKPSYPWPKELEDRTWTVGYVDGDHRHPQPRRDLDNLSARTSSYLIIDDFGKTMLDIRSSVLNFMLRNPDQTLFMVFKNCIVLRKV
mgnify:CR=1 FL=1